MQIWINAVGQMGWLLECKHWLWCGATHGWWLWSREVGMKEIYWLTGDVKTVWL